MCGITCKNQILYSFLHQEDSRIHILIAFNFRPTDDPAAGTPASSATPKASKALRSRVATPVEVPGATASPAMTPEIAPELLAEEVGVDEDPAEAAEAAEAGEAPEASAEAEEAAESAVPET